MLNGKHVILGVSGSIAAYKAAALTSLLKKQHADVTVIMTKNACEFVNPVTFETLSGNRCLVDTFDRNFQFEVEHVSLAKKADLVIVAPATANVIGKISAGIADDMLTTTILACQCPKLIAPAMNTRMYENPIVRQNISRLQQFGFQMIQPEEGVLACGDTGKGRMEEPEILLQYVLKEIALQKDLKGRHVLVTAGATKEPLDPVRYITNHSTGKMGYAIARMAAFRGADVTVIAGGTTAEPPMFVRHIQVEDAQEMYQTVCKEFPRQQLVFQSAAVADYTPAVKQLDKIKKSDSKLILELIRTNDILQYICEHKVPGQFVCGFSMETNHLIENSKRKLEKKGADLIVANNLRDEGAGFAHDTNVVTLITADEVKPLPLMSKDEVANQLLDFVLERYQPV